MRMTAFYSEAKDVRLAIFHALPEFAADENLRGWVWGGDVPDTAALEAEIRTLRDENARFKEEANSSGTLKQTIEPEKISDILQTLREIDVEVPASINSSRRWRRPTFSTSCSGLATV
ncbi:MAG TPA: hypothetical protein VF619_12985 [Allosphingosinicella sp.]|jgi:hypothetical protein